MSSTKFSLRIGTMRCLGTEDYSDDEIRVYVTPDGDELKKKELTWDGASAGDHHFFGDRFHFNTTLRIAVEEYDQPDLDDSIGEITIDAENINDEHVRMDPWFFGDYSLTWTNLTPHRDELENKHQEISDNQPSEESMEDGLSADTEQKSKEAHTKIGNHMNEDGRGAKVYESYKETVHTFKRTANEDKIDEDERIEAVEKLKTALNFLTLQGFAEEASLGNWGSIIVVGLLTPAEFGFADFGLSYGFAISTDPGERGASMLLGFDIAVGFTEGDEAKIAIGWNRNIPEKVPGLTYNYSIPADGELTGAITFSYDGEPIFPKLQEITYSYSPLPAGVSAGWDYTFGKM